MLRKIPSVLSQHVKYIELYCAQYLNNRRYCWDAATTHKVFAPTQVAPILAHPLSLSTSFPQFPAGGSSHSSS